MPRILVSDAIDKSSIEEIVKMGIDVTVQHYDIETLKQEIKEYDGIIIRSATKVRKELIDAAMETGKLKLVVRGGVGLDNVDVAYAMENGITVKNTPDSSKVSVAELAIAHMLTIARKLHHANMTMRDGKWLKNDYQGTEIEGKTLGLIGFGRIAQTTAIKAAALGMNVIYTNRSGKVEGMDQLKYVSKEELLKNSDFISLHIPYDKETGAVIGQKEFEMMKDGVFLVNCARGGVVCEKALLEALDNGKVAAAALDVFEDEPTKNEAIYKHDRISLSPHIGASTDEAQEKIGAEIVKIIRDFF